MSPKEAEAKKVKLETNKGDIVIELATDMPITTGNFEKLVSEGFYDGVIFHRVIKGFVIQGGDPTGTGAGGKSCWGKEFEDEFAAELVFNKVGILAMANRGPNTNGSQFFITTAKTPWLNHKHTIFGEVIKGYDVVQKLEQVPTDSRDKPKEEQKIIKAYMAN